jgi:hypothetical protein
MKPPPLTDCCNDWGAAGDQGTHGRNEAIRKALHLADLIHEVDPRGGIGPKQRHRAIERLDVNAILAHALALREVHMRNDVHSSLEADQPEAHPLSSFADLLGIEAPDPIGPKVVGDAPDHGGLADARHPRDQEDICLPLSAFRHHRLSFGILRLDAARKRAFSMARLSDAHPGVDPT